MRLYIKIYHKQTNLRFDRVFLGKNKPNQGAQKEKAADL